MKEDKGKNKPDNKETLNIWGFVNQLMKDHLYIKNCTKVIQKDTMRSKLKEWIECIVKGNIISSMLVLNYYKNTRKIMKS